MSGTDVALVGGLSRPSKMPGPSFNLPADACVTGSKLRLVPGSVCASCYATKGRYFTHRVKAALARRLELLGGEEWVPAMIRLIRRRAHSGCFRWHDSGDLQS